MNWESIITVETILDLHARGIAQYSQTAIAISAPREIAWRED